MQITAELVKELREKTGVGMMECKKALTETGGDIEKAVLYLRERGLAAANKKSGRETREGILFVATAPDQKTAVLVELNCETDFVAKNDQFSALGQALAKLCLDHADITSETLPEAKLNGKAVKEVVSEAVLKIGENIVPGQVKRLKGTGAVYIYVHQNGKIAALAATSQPVDTQVGKDLVMHITASAPLYLKPEDVPAEELEKEKEIIRKQVENEGKTGDVAEKIVAGKLNKFAKDICLLEQPFVKDPKKSVKQILPQEVSIEGFVRFSLV